MRSILQPLPIRPAALRLAKLTAVAALGAGVAVAVNVFPTLVFPWMLAFAVPQMSACATAATDRHAGRDHGERGGVRLSGGDRAFANGRARCSATTLFARVSPWLQTIAIVVIGSAILLLPLVSTRVGQRGFTGWRADAAADGVRRRL